ncbi:MAG: YdcF family protein [Alphaproteobacteria bacterium]|nr:YdcF family protein [Alphaproteobacteria bacterium]
MSFTASKVLGLVFEPGNFLLLLLVLGAVASLLGAGRWARALLGLGIAGLVAIAVLPLGGFLLATLEARFPAAAPPDKVNGIIVLGGAVQTGLSAARGQPALNHNAEREFAFVALARRYPEARLVYAGGEGRLFPTGSSEAEIARALHADLGLDVARVLYEGRSRNTWENATLARDLAQPAAGETWLLVTSARHMPRAIGTFRRAGWAVTAHPVDFRTAGAATADIDFNLGAGLRGLGEAAHEWGGLLVYFLLGRTSEFLPGPK